MVALYVAVTDRGWFDRLAASAPHDELNFWQPSGSREFRRLQSGELFLFKLHAPDNFIVGGGIFSNASNVPLSIAWESFGLKNGVASLPEMRRRIAHYRDDPAILDERIDPVVGCRIITEPFFWPREQWIPVPASWSQNIVTGKGYDAEQGDGLALWHEVEARQAYKSSGSSPLAAARTGKPVLVTPRLGQGAFRLWVTDSYERRCAVTGENTLPILDVAHIKRPSTRARSSATASMRRLRSRLSGEEAFRRTLPAVSWRERVTVGFKKAHMVGREPIGTVLSGLINGGYVQHLRAGRQNASSTFCIS
jgi:putative restriction endonuclease